MNVPKIVKVFMNSAQPGCPQDVIPHKLHPLGLEPMRTRPGLGRTIPSKGGALECPTILS